MIIKLASALNTVLGWAGKTVSAKGVKAFSDVLRNPIVRNAGIGAATGAVTGFATGDENHKLRSTIMGAGIGAVGGGLGTAALQKGTATNLRRDWSRFTGRISKIETPIAADAAAITRKVKPSPVPAPPKDDLNTPAIQRGISPMPVPKPPLTDLNVPTYLRQGGK